MFKPRNLGIAAMLVALSGAITASAQTVASLKIVSGDGQAICPCVSATLQSFQPITVQALSSGGQPVANATIYWKVTSGNSTNMSLAPIAQPIIKTLTTQTDANGMSSAPISQIITITQGTLVQPFLQSSILASPTVINDNQGPPPAVQPAGSQTFWETVSLVDEHGSAEIQAGVPVVRTTQGYVSLDQVTFSGNSGTNFPLAIEDFVGGNGLASNGVANVSIRLQALQTSPSISCAPGVLVGSTLIPPGDPGANLSVPIYNINPALNVACVPVFGGSGNGQFVILIGGLPSDPSALQYLQVYGPYSFTSIAGAPAAMQILQGNNQVAAPGQSLGTLIAKVVDSKGNGVQNVNVKWVATPNAAVTIQSAQTTTDNNGEISAVAGFSGVAAGQVTITVSSIANPNISATFTETSTALISSLTKVSGDLQSAQAGASFTAPLVVQVKGAANPVANYPVQFSVVSGSVSLSTATPLTDNNGNAQVTVTAGATVGNVTIKAAVGNLSQTFTLTVLPAGPTPNGIIRISGDGQSAVVNTGFNLPLIVQVNSTSGPVPNYVVQFSGTSNVTLSASSAITNAIGQAQITVQAGGAVGSATVTASIPSYSTSFTLNISPQGPTLTTDSFANAASGQKGYISPCGLATITASGLPSGAANLFPAPVFGPLPTQVNGVSASFNNVLAPIASETLVNGQPQLMVQIPCEISAGTSVPVAVNVGAGVARINVNVMSASPGIFQNQYSDGAFRAVVLRADGSFATLTNPARRGEIVRIYATGLGPTLPVVGTNQVDNPGADLLGADAQAVNQVFVGINNTTLASVQSTRLAANLIGVFEIAFIVPNNAPQGNDIAVTLTVVPQGTQTHIDALQSKIPIQ